MESETTIWLIESPVVMVSPFCHSERVSEKLPDFGRDQ
jgi:hypothetical protein